MQDRGRTKISVIIPAFNMGAFIAQAIASVLAGTFNRCEVIVVDDGSTDQTASVVQNFTRPESRRYDPRVRYFFQENSGKPAAVNYGFRQARGEYIAILDADDLLPPEGLSLRYEAGQSADGPRQLVVGGFEVVDGEVSLGERMPPKSARASAHRRRFYLSYRTPFHLNGCLIPRALLDAVGGFDVHLGRCADIDYSLRLLKRCAEMVVVNAPVYSYRKYRSSLWSRMRFRIQTAYDRPFVLWKNTKRPLGLAAACYGVVVDVGKAFYELSGNYRR